MKLYKVSTESKTKWVGSKADAASAHAEFCAEGTKRADITIQEVDVPTTKPELLAWLNKEAV